MTRHLSRPIKNEHPTQQSCKHKCLIQYCMYFERVYYKLLSGLSYYSQLSFTRLAPEVAQYKLGNNPTVNRNDLLNSSYLKHKINDITHKSSLLYMCECCIWTLTFYHLRWLHTRTRVRACDMHTYIYARAHALCMHRL